MEMNLWNKKSESFSIKGSLWLAGMMWQNEGGKKEEYTMYNVEHLF